MIRAWTPQHIREAERSLLDAGAGDRLMSRAAATLAAVCIRELDRKVYGRRVVLLVGKGNNGGDTLYAGRRLADRGARVDAVLTSPDAHSGGLAALQESAGRIHALDDGDGSALALLLAADLVVDGIVGTGARAGLRSPVRELVADWQGPRNRPAAGTAHSHRPAGRVRQLVIAVDVPSGIDAATGDASPPCIAADVTVTFAGAKPGLLLPPASGYAGRIVVVDIGIPLAREAATTGRLERSDIADRWPVPAGSDHKYTRGVLGVVAGSAAYPGAAVLTSGGARAAGVGMIRYIGPESVASAVNAAFPEIVPGPGRVQAWLLGPGIDPGDGDGMERVYERLEQAAETQLPCIMDAGALAAVHRPEERETPAPMILTPHAGELATLLTRLGDDATRTDIESAPAHWALRAACTADAVVVLKGATTVIASADGTTYTSDDGSSWLATAGAGDVLAGIIGAITATSAESATGKSLPALAGYAALGVLVHGLSAGRASASGPIAAGDISAVVPAVLAELLQPAVESRPSTGNGHANRSGPVAGTGHPATPTDLK